MTTPIAERESTYSRREILALFATASFGVLAIRNLFMKNQNQAAASGSLVPNEFDTTCEGAITDPNSAEARQVEQMAREIYAVRGITDTQELLDESCKGIVGPSATPNGTPLPGTD